MVSDNQFQFHVFLIRPPFRGSRAVMSSWLAVLPVKVISLVEHPTQIASEDELDRLQFASQSDLLARFEMCGVPFPVDARLPELHQQRLGRRDASCPRSGKLA